MRAFFAVGMDKMHLPRAVEALPALIHLSLFLFFAGLAIYMFNINHSVFIYVTCWVGLFTAVYVWMTVMPIFRHDSPYYAPLSSTVWLLHAFLLCALYRVLFFVTVIIFGCFRTCVRRQTVVNFYHSSKYHGGRMLRGVLKAAEETTSTQSSDIDLGILDWIMGALGEDETLERFFDAIPGFFNSQIVKNLDGPLPDMVRSKFAESLDGFLTRNLSSNSVSVEIKHRRLVICMNAAKATCHSYDTRKIIRHLFRLRFDQVPLSFQTADILTRWCTSNDVSPALRLVVSNIFLFVQERDDRWIALAKDRFGLPEDVLRSNIAHGDNSVLLAILIHMTHQVIRTDPEKWWILSLLSQFDIHDTHTGLQSDFCALWNELVLKARVTRHPHRLVLHSIRRLYIGLHEGTDAAPTAFDSSTKDWDNILRRPSSYPLCNIATHHPNSATPCPTQLHHPSRSETQPISDRSTDAQQTEEANTISGFRSTSDYAPLTQELPSPAPSTTDPVHLVLQVTSATVPPIHESVQTVTLDLNRLVAMQVSHLSPRSSLSIANPTTNIVRNTETTPDVPLNETRETSQTPSATLLTLPHHDPVPVTVTPYFAPHPPSVEQQGNFSDLPNVFPRSLHCFTR